MVNDSAPAVADALHSAPVRLLRLARTADVEMDLDGPRASALSVVVFGGPILLSRLAAAEQVSPRAMAKTVAALEAAGLVTRERAEAASPGTDRRIVLVHATDAGRTLLTRGRQARVKLIAYLIADLPPEDREALHRAADILLNTLSTRP